MDFILLPIPKKIDLKTGHFALNAPVTITIPDRSLFLVAKRLQHELFVATGIEARIEIGESGTITFIPDYRLQEQAYELSIDERGVAIRFHQGEGASYGVSTLKQLLYQAGKSLPFLIIQDKPDFPRRGLMLDISRDKIPTMDTLYRLVDLMVDLKYNELQLYIEGFSFAYPSFPEVWQDQTPLLPEEILALDAYCKDRFIDLVPNQNSFGHMAPWLNRLEYRDLAVCPEGCLSPWGTWTKNTTLDPQDERSLRLVLKQYDDLLPYFSSSYFNVGLDEPIELGHGKSEAICRKKGVGRVYLEYLLKIYDEVKKRGKTMMFWGDIIIKYPELIQELPKDVIALEWGYEGTHPFEKRLFEYAKAGVPFYVCPGTSSWNSILGRTNNMRDNILNAALHGKALGARGFLLTDWGDNGHIQYLPISYPAFCFGAAVSWSVETNRAIDVNPYLNRFVFQDDASVMGQLLWDLGNTYERESVKIGNGTKLFFGFRQRLNDAKEIQNYIKGLKIEDYLNVLSFLESKLAILQTHRMRCHDAPLIEREVQNGILYVRHGAKRILYMLGYYLDEVAILDELSQEIRAIMKEHAALWIMRNRVGGLEDSLKEMRRMRDEYDALLQPLIG